MEFNPFSSDLEAYRFEWAYQEGSGDWDIERPQPAFVDVLQKGWISGDVLEVGCGSGNLSIFLASRGLKVLGVDFSPTAIRTANRKAREHGSEADFTVWNALHLGSINREFDTVVDSAMLHCLEPGEKKAYVHELEKIIRPGGKFIVLIANDYMSTDELETLFSSWRKEFVADSVFETKSEDMDAVIACFSR